MANTIEWGIILQRTLDRHMIQNLTSGWMDSNAGQVQYTGGKEIKVPIMQTQGLGDYGRNTTGYPVGNIDLRYQTFEMRMDRGREFNFDRHDVDESNYIVNASNVLSVFQANHVVPEVDSYRYSTIAAGAIAEGYTRDYTPEVDTLLTELMKDINTIQDRTGATDLIVSMNWLVYGILSRSKELSRNLDAASFQQGQVQMTVRGIDGVPIVPVPSARMKTAYVYKDAVTSGQTEGGFTPDASAKDINWIICPRTSPMAITKQDQVKIFEPNVNQTLDSWKTQYRRYHDLWMLENKLPAYMINTQP